MTSDTGAIDRAAQAGILITSPLRANAITFSADGDWSIKLTSDGRILINPDLPDAESAAAKMLAKHYGCAITARIQELEAERARAAQAVREIVAWREQLLQAAKEEGNAEVVKGCRRALLTARECLAAVEAQR